MSPDVVMGALIFFHHQLTFLYFPRVLPNLVFTRPQTPLDCINAIVQFSYKVESGDVKGVTDELTSSLRDGIVTEEILGHELLSKCFVPDLYEPRDAINLLCHTFTLAPLTPPKPESAQATPQPTPPTPVERKKKQYLMMSLRQAIPEKDIPSRLPKSSEIASLVVQFSGNCVPLSCFSRTISCLLATFNWELIRAKDDSPESLAHNVVSLRDPQLPAKRCPQRCHHTSGGPHPSRQGLQLRSLLQSVLFTL